MLATSCNPFPSPSCENTSQWECGLVCTNGIGVHYILEHNWCTLYTRMWLVHNEKVNIGQPILINTALHRENTWKQQQGEKLGIKESMEFNRENSGCQNPLPLDDCWANERLSQPFSCQHAHMEKGLYQLLWQLCPWDPDCWAETQHNNTNKL